MYTGAVPAPAAFPTLQRRWLLTAGMLIALIQSSIFAVVDPDLSGWHPQHGHASVGGFVEDHTHPWDHNHREAPAFGDPVEIGFTGPTGEVGSVAGLALPGAVLLAIVGAIAAAALAHRSARAPRSEVTEVLLPPPRS